MIDVQAYATAAILRNKFNAVFFDGLDDRSCRDEAGTP